MALKRAGWWPRFWAWLIDAIIGSVIVSLLFVTSFAAGFWLNSAGFFVMFIYWTVLESDGRQSLGKKALGLRTVTEKGKPVSLTGALLNSFGKSFLLPLDFIIGVLARPGKKQRLFNIASDTVVVKS